MGTENHTTLTPARHKRIVELLKQGHFRETVCAQVGITARTLRNWVARGEEGDPRWSQFARDVREAESNIEVDTVFRINLAGEKDWKALAWFLEKRFPRHWGRHEAAMVKLEAERAAMLEALTKTLEKRGLNDAIEDVLRELAGGGTDEASATPGEARTEH
jgi:hypothetical protein